MKCIKKEMKETVDGKIKKTMEIKRVKNEEANDLVKKDNWSFCPKQEWKAKTSPKKEIKKEKNQEEAPPKNKYRSGRTRYNNKEEKS